MATLANCEVIAAKRALTIMASHATLSPPGGVMIERLRRGYLSPLRHAGSDLMAFTACNLLMLCMTKANAECLRGRRRPRIPAQLMTSAARRDIAAAGLRTRRVASITSCVRVEAGGYRQGNATTRRSMTRRTTDTSHLHVARVIKLHSEALQTRE